MNNLYQIGISDLQVRCIHEMFEQQCLLTPDTVAVVFGKQQLTYSKLNQLANQLARYLRVLGVGSEVMVGISLERSLLMVVGVLGVLKAGGAYVPLDPAYPKERLNFILSDTQTRILLTTATLLPNLPAITGEVVCLDTQWFAVAKHSQENLGCQTTPENLMYVIYTSGSTGKPKGVMIPHRGIFNQLYWRQTTFGLNATDKVLQNISFSFDPSVWQIFWPLCFGAQLILPRPDGHKDTRYLVTLIAQEKITTIALVPSMLRLMLSTEGIENCKCLRYIFCGGSALPVELIQHFFECFNLDTALYNVYGPTEASIDATFWKCSRKTSTNSAPIGRPIFNTSIYILDENLQPTKPGESGSVYISGAGLARGYLNDPKLTSEKFIVNPFSSEPEARLYNTGDIARFLPDGNIEFLGRSDSQVKVRGFRVELREIEATLRQLPEVKETVVVVREDNFGDRHLVAYVVPKANTALTANLIRGYLRQKLADYMLPTAIVMLSALPLTVNGKVDRCALPAPDLIRPELEKEFVPPRDELETELVDIWRSILNIQSIGVKDNFFELGGNSLQATWVLALASKIFGKILPMTLFLHTATVEDMKIAIQQDEECDFWSILVPIQTRGNRPPLFCVHGADANILLFKKLSLHLNAEQPLYAFQPRLLDDKQPFQGKIEEIAAGYITQMRTVRPHGPYYLAGYSYGGTIAFEMAQQLSAQGEKIALLALFDSLSPTYFKPLSLKLLVTHGRNFLRLPLREKLAYLQLVGDRIINRTADRKQSSIVINKVEVADVNAKLLARAISAVHQYVAQIYPGKITLFRCQQQRWWATSDRELGWSSLSKVPVEVHDINSDHNQILRKNAYLLALKLNDCLNISQTNFDYN